MIRPDAARPEPGDRPDATPGGLTVAEAAARLAVTPDAIRRRLHRGTLAGAKTVEGEWRVWLPDGEAGGAPASPPGRPPVDRQDTARTPPVPQETTPHSAIEARLESQQTEITYLREQLAERSRELAAERERFDVLHREALARIPALSAGQDAPQASPAVHHAPDDDDDEDDLVLTADRPLRGPSAPIGPPAWRTTETAEAERVPWWRRWWERWQ